MFKDPGWALVAATGQPPMLHVPVVTTRPGGGNRRKPGLAHVRPLASATRAGESLLTGGTLQGPPAQEPQLGPSLATEAAAEAFFWWPVVGGWHVQPAIDLTEAGTEGQDIESRTQ